MGSGDDGDDDDDNDDDGNNHDGNDRSSSSTWEKNFIIWYFFLQNIKLNDFIMAASNFYWFKIIIYDLLQLFEAVKLLEWKTKQNKSSLQLFQKSPHCVWI